ELALATRIQADMLPNIYPAFPERKEFDIYGSMDPAKEVGGDFYNFFLIDEDHLCMIMADVSGKGVPAALFMMASLIILSNNAMIGKNPAQILTDTNAAICNNNREEMFVTVWLGILEISTGKLVAANAGHEYPALKQPNGQFELIKDKHGFVLGGMEGLKYQEYELMLEPGAKLFLYTDGVPEATNSETQQFGTDRMVKALNQDPDSSPRQILKNVRQSVDDFVKEAEQFDDLTMLCLEYNGKV
ncbi:MAG: PP2C family protein-serine/threonine phosphatase, partial [Lachnospiraceae bacterium]|nr:PP2C family protein-serine/threonine phosphatase [Lachnospiraceae bacterium]